MENYIVRIYRREEGLGKAPERIIGTVETVGVEEKKTFHTAQELTCLFDCGPTDEKRRAERLPLKLPLKVLGRNTFGGMFTEETIIENLSSRGACFLLKNPVARDTDLGLLVDLGRSDLNLKGRVARIARVDGARTVGVVFEYEKKVHSRSEKS
jgi:hypothetical protein